MSTVVAVTKCLLVSVYPTMGFCHMAVTKCLLDTCRSKFHTFEIYDMYKLLQAHLTTSNLFIAHYNPFYFEPIRNYSQSISL